MFRLLVFLLTLTSFESSACRTVSSSLALDHLVKVSFGAERDIFSIELPAKLYEYKKPIAYLKYQPIEKGTDGSGYTKEIQLEPLDKNLIGTFTVLDENGFTPFVEVYWGAPADDMCGAVSRVNIRKLP
jgi:hypothetical protein